MNGCRLGCLILFLFSSIIGWADEPKKALLSEKEIQEGWLLLFDGETTFGWKKQDQAQVVDGQLIMNSSEKDTVLLSTTTFSSFRMIGQWQSDVPATVSVHSVALPLSATTKEEWKPFTIEVQKQTIQFQEGQAATRKTAVGKLAPVQFTIPSNQGTLKLRDLKLLPLGAKSIFNGKDLTGWKVHPGVEYKSKFSVTKEGWLNVLDGKGDLQTEAQYQDFLLQFECISNGKLLNSGIFFRCLPNQYQNGYEAQIHNGFKDKDRTKPIDFGTGAIYRRIPSRKVIPNDNEWFTMTVLAQGNHIATWVNGYPTVDWIDDRPADDNPRKGSKTGKGHISIQGHDPTTNLNFRNLRILELPANNR